MNVDTLTCECYDPGLHMPIVRVLGADIVGAQFVATYISARVAGSSFAFVFFVLVPRSAGGSIPCVYKSKQCVNRRNYSYFPIYLLYCTLYSYYSAGTGPVTCRLFIK